MTERNTIEEVELRIKQIPRWRLILGVILLIPPISIIGMAFLTYEIYKSGERI